MIIYTNCTGSHGPDLNTSDTWALMTVIGLLPWNLPFIRARSPIHNETNLGWVTKLITSMVIPLIQTAIVVDRFSWIGWEEPWVSWAGFVIQASAVDKITSKQDNNEATILITQTKQGQQNSSGSLSIIKDKHRFNKSPFWQTHPKQRKLTFDLCLTIQLPMWFNTWERGL